MNRIKSTVNIKILERPLGIVRAFSFALDAACRAWHNANCPCGNSGRFALEKAKIFRKKSKVEKCTPCVHFLLTFEKSRGILCARFELQSATT